MVRRSSIGKSIREFLEAGESIFGKLFMKDPTRPAKKIANEKNLYLAKYWTSHDKGRTFHAGFVTNTLRLGWDKDSFVLLDVNDCLDDREYLPSPKRDFPGYVTPSNL